MVNFKLKVQFPVTSPSPGLVDDGVQRLCQLVCRQTVEVQDDGGAAAAQTGEVIRLIGEQRNSDQRHTVIHGLVQTVRAAVSHKRSGPQVTSQKGNRAFIVKGSHVKMNKYF